MAPVAIASAGVRAVVASPPTTRPAAALVATAPATRRARAVVPWWVALPVTLTASPEIGRG